MSAPEKDTFSLAKALHHINIARQYLEDVKIGMTGNLKATFGGYVNKCEFILNDVLSKLGDQSRSIYKEELSDSLGIDAINDKLMYLDNEQRNKLEEILEVMAKGTKIKITIEDL